MYIYIYIYIYRKSCNVSAVNLLNSVQANLVIHWGCLLKGGGVYWVGKKRKVFKINVRVVFKKKFQNKN
jgi:hypothetical protein